MATVRKQIRNYIDRHPTLTQRSVAAGVGMSHVYLNQLLVGDGDRRDVPPRLVEVLDFLGMELRVVPPTLPPTDGYERTRADSGGR